MKILAVDDELSALHILERCIKACDPECELYSTDDSSKALEEAKNGTFVPDIAGMDIEMPSPNGIELGKELKKINPHLNVIFVTGYPEYMRDALNMFVSGYLLKPVTREDLQVQLDHLRFPVNEKISDSMHRPSESLSSSKMENRLSLIQRKQKNCWRF